MPTPMLDMSSSARPPGTWFKIKPSENPTFYSHQASHSSPVPLLKHAYNFMCIFIPLHIVILCLHKGLCVIEGPSSCLIHTCILYAWSSTQPRYVLHEYMLVREEKLNESSLNIFYMIGIGDKQNCWKRIACLCLIVGRKHRTFHHCIWCLQ